MKRLLTLFLALVVSSVAAPADRATLRERFGQTGDDVWRSALEPEKSNPRVSTFFNYALTLCETGLNPERLEKLFALAAARQDLDPKIDGEDVGRKLLVDAAGKTTTSAVTR